MQYIFHKKGEKRHNGKLGMPYLLYSPFWLELLSDSLLPLTVYCAIISTKKRKADIKKQSGRFPPRWRNWSK